MRSDRPGLLRGARQVQLERLLPQGRRERLQGLDRQRRVGSMQLFGREPDDRTRVAFAADLQRDHALVEEHQRPGCLPDDPGDPHDSRLVHDSDDLPRHPLAKPALDHLGIMRHAEQKQRRSPIVGQHRFVGQPGIEPQQVGERIEPIGAREIGKRLAQRRGLDERADVRYQQKTQPRRRCEIGERREVQGSWPSADGRHRRRFGRTAARLHEGRGADRGRKQPRSARDRGHRRTKHAVRHDVVLQLVVTVT